VLPERGEGLQVAMELLLALVDGITHPTSQSNRSASAIQVSYFRER
jgi:hypothetical protein